MKPGWLATTMLAEAVTAFATLPCSPTVMATLANGQLAPAIQLGLAQGLTTRIFAPIGVRILWRAGAPPVALPPCTEAVTIVLDDGSVPAGFAADALAYATVGSVGTAIHVFYRRIVRSHDRGVVTALLGHVFAHEIAHVLENVARHSAAGVLKAHWTQDDFAEMCARPLVFAPADVELIRARFRL